MESITLSQETVRLIADVLKARETPVSELSTVIAAIRSGVDLLSHSDAPIRSGDSADTVTEQRLVLTSKTPRKRVHAAVKVPNVLDDDGARVPAEPEIHAEIVEPSHGRLLRRADMLAHALDHHPEPIFAVAGAATNTARGVVKWFDGRTSKGALRLMGMSADVPLNSDVMATSGIKRLYKDQEIEATVDHHDGRARLVSLSLPGRNREASALGRVGAISVNLSSSSATRQPNDVSVHIKHDLSRQRQARAAAENLLGKLDLVKTSQ